MTPCPHTAIFAHMNTDIPALLQSLPAITDTALVRRDSPTDPWTAVDGDTTHPADTIPLASIRVGSTVFARIATQPPSE